MNNNILTRELYYDIPSFLLPPILCSAAVGGGRSTAVQGKSTEHFDHQKGDGGTENNNARYYIV